MKRLIFSIFTDQIDDHSSAPTWKQQQFSKYKHIIERSQRAYAERCGAEYKLFNTDLTNYDNIQFQKLFLLEELAEEYDEVLYIDFDVIPMSNENFFEANDMSKICAVLMECDIKSTKDLLAAIGTFDSMSMYCKGALKRAMLLEEGITSSQTIFNTGVVGGSSEAISKLKFKENLADIKELYEIVREESIWPEEVTNNWKPNNEVFFTYLIEINNIEHNAIGVQWNFFVTQEDQRVPASIHFAHMSNKEFEKVL